MTANFDGALEKLRARDLDAFAALIDDCSPMMLRLAAGIVGGELAPEIVQDAWVSAFEAIARFEGRSSIRTWLGQIVVNRARTIARREKRTVPLADEDDEIDRLIDEHGRWLAPAVAWSETPDTLVERAQVSAAIEAALAALPELHRTVVMLRDVEGFSAEEACHILNLTASNQRQLLHRARLRLRRALEKTLR